MSSTSMARRTDYQIHIEGVDITEDIRPYFMSVSFTDNEEDEADDLQIKLHDREGLWQNAWLGAMLKAAVLGYKYHYSPSSSSSGSSSSSSSSGSSGSSGSGSGSSSKKYKVTAENGLRVHSRPGAQYHVYGTLVYGTIIKVEKITDGWAKFDYNDKTGYVASKYLKKVSSGSGSSSGSGTRGGGSSGSSSQNGWEIGESVIANGRPQQSAWGNGTPGAVVHDYKSTITHLHFGNGATYPICVGDRGWFKESEVQKASGSSSGSVSGALKIQCAMFRRNWDGSGADKILECGQFELDSITSQGPPATVTIKATSLSYGNSIRQTKKTFAWENYYLKSIAKRITENNGMGLMYLSSQNPKFSRQEQYKESDIAFLKRLCHDAGCSLKVTNNILVIFDQAEYEAKPSIKTLEIGDGCERYKLSTKDEDSYTSCRVSYTKSDGTVISSTVYVDDYNPDDEKNQCLKITRRVSSKAEATKLAHEMLRLHNKFAFEGTFTYPFDPSLCAGCTVRLGESYGAFKGKYMIKRASHKIDSSSTTQITLRHVL